MLSPFPDLKELIPVTNTNFVSVTLQDTKLKKSHIFCGHFFSKT